MTLVPKRKQYRQHFVTAIGMVRIHYGTLDWETHTEEHMWSMMFEYFTHE